MARYVAASRTLNPAANSRFGLGSEESGLSAPLLTISGVVLQQPRRGMPFGLSPYTTAPYGNIGTVMTGYPPPPPMGTSLYAQALGALDKDAEQANKCKKDHGKLRDSLRDTMNAITKQLGYDKQQTSRCYFRLGEILARADKNIAALGWGYAGPNSNEPNSKDGEGTDFVSAAGETKKALGFEGRIKAEESKSAGTGRMCQYKALLQSTNAVAKIIQAQFDATSGLEAKRALFCGMMTYYLSGDKNAASFAKGMAFLPMPASYTPPAELATLKKAGLKKEESVLGIAQKAGSKAAKKAIDDALSSKKRPKEAQPSEAFSQMPAEALAPPGQDLPPEPSSAGGGKTGLIAIAAAAVGAYFIMKS